MYYTTVLQTVQYDTYKSKLTKLISSYIVY